MEEQGQKFIDRVNIICVLDHSGRAGNGFFLTIFDQHPEVLTCPWMHYTYSYLIAEFSDSPWIETERAFHYWTKISYFKFVYNDLDENLSKQLIKFGGDPASKVDREKVREVFNHFLSGKDRVTRKELVLITYLSYAMGINRDLDKIKYILVSDAPSLRHENVLREFSGQVVSAIKADFPSPKLISLVRDPRAVFASSRHQFVNSQGNMYGIRFGNYLEELKDLLLLKLSMGKGCVYLYWLAYIASTGKTIYFLKRKYKEDFITVRNEDLNTKFVNSLESITRWLGVSFFKEWAEEGYQPTMVGKTWRGTGAYNSQYQTYRYGPLENDPDEIARKVTGPNIYVTQRWKTRLGKNEIKVIETLFREELADLSYEFLYWQDKQFPRLNFILNVILPFKGELPTLEWIKKGKFVGKKEVCQRIFYSFSFWPFYILSRIILIGLYLRGFFYNGKIPERQKQ